MMTSIAIQAYFNRMRHFFTRQGFDGSMKVVYGADAEGPQRLLDQDLANKEMERKSQTDRETVRSKPYTYLFWTRDSLTNIARRPVKLRDGFTPDGKARFKKTITAEFGMGCVLVSNKATLIEDFAEAFATEYQNMHTIPINLKFGYDDRSPIGEGGFDTPGLNFTAINEMIPKDAEELISFRAGDLFSYSWNVRLLLNVVSEFADTKLAPLKRVVVDLYNQNGVPLSSMDFSKPLQFDEDGNIIGMAHNATEKDDPTIERVEILKGDYVADDGTVVHDVPDRAFVSLPKPNPPEKP